MELNNIERILQSRERGLLSEDTYRKYAVLIPLVKLSDGSTGVLFEKRALHLRNQAGEICFPGGKREEGDSNMWETAARETREELNLPEGSIRYVGELDILVTHSHRIIYPYVGNIDVPYPLQPNSEEVGEVFTVALKHFIDNEPERHNVSVSVQPEDTFPFHLIPGGREYAWHSGEIPQYFYEVNGRVIWGMTAKILYHFVRIIRQ